ncbi:hypothetical protein D187_006503 [Cystobacter fuscus DSM 2262]|uniref:Uncharacterized protein n=1 Tax=Cystobacter fuscus (strain ATCC 25194 / DSM 2262 / NBRC 100088 / M29) TaxID=1242864 RepID=S9R2G2_CYSF2|nr:hypothetical protein D187_006503 [Cystobacter fuscus DSM 2262]
MRHPSLPGNTNVLAGCSPSGLLDEAPPCVSCFSLPVGKPWSPRKG